MVVDGLSRLMVKEERPLDGYCCVGRTDTVAFDWSRAAFPIVAIGAAITSDGTWRPIIDRAAGMKWAGLACGSPVKGFTSGRPASLTPGTLMVVERIWRPSVERNSPCQRWREREDRVEWWVE